MSYSFKDYIFEFLWLNKWRFKPWSEIKLHHDALVDAINDFNFELDCISIIKSIREIKTIIGSLDESDQTLIKYHHSKSLNSRHSRKFSVNSSPLEITEVEEVKDDKSNYYP